MAKHEKRDSNRQPEASTRQPASPPSAASPLTRHSSIWRIQQWFFSKTVRHATEMRKHVGKLLAAQRDILSPPAIEAITAALEDLRQTLASTVDKKMLGKEMENLEKVANKWLRPYPHSAIRE